MTEEDELTTLFVGNLSPEATESDLRAAFSPFGRIISLRVVRSRGGRARGFAYVELAEDEAAAAIEALKDHELKGRRMDIVAEQSPSSGRHGRHVRRSGFRRRH